MSKEELPSIDDEIISDLPSVEDFITEENAEELPSVEEYIEKEEVVETVEEEVEQATDLTEIVRLINDVRKDIPDIPEVKYYDAELEKLCEIVDQVRSEIPEVKSYDSDIEAICSEIDLVKENIQDLPEVKYYDEQVTLIEDRIDTLQTEVTNLPEVKYYDKEIEAICGAIDDVKSQIPKFPKWVNEINEVPDFSWIGKTFSVIDDDFIKVNDTIDGLQTKVDFDLNELSEDIDKKYFESSVKVTTLDEKVNTRIDEEKDKIWKELRASSLKIWEYHKEFKDDDKKLKKQVLGEYNSLKQNIKKELKEINYTSVKTDELLLKYFTELKEEISELPEVKYYDEDLKHLRSDIKGLYKIVEDIKETNKILQEEQKLLSETNVPLGEDPPDTKNPDPLTPLDQNFVTLDQLKNHYKVFVERVQYQLASIGGGGAGFIKDLDDVDISGITTGSLLIYKASTQKWVGIASTALGGGGGDADSASSLTLDVRNNNVGYALTIGTPVYQVGYNSGQDRLNVEIANADTPSTMPAKGVVSTTLENNTNGQIIVYGELEGVNTSAFEVADELYVAPGGGLTNVRPTDPTHLVQKIAVVLKKSTANGAILVYGAGRTNDVPNNISIAGSITAVDGFFSGNVTVGGTITYEDVKNIDSIGIITARTGIKVLDGGINVVGVSTISTGVGTVHVGVGSTALLVEGDARVTGILTIGQGSITLDPTARKIEGIDEIIIGTGTTVRIHQDSSGEIAFSDRQGKQASVGIGTTVSINTTGIITAATLKASTAFYPPLYTTTARDAGSFSQGAIIFNTTSLKLEFYDGTSWQQLPGMTLGLTVALDG